MRRGRRTEVTIDALVLEGVRPGEAELVGAAIERELTRLVRECGLPDGMTNTPVPGRVELRAGEPPTELGARLANAIYGRLVP